MEIEKDFHDTVGNQGRRPLFAFSSKVEIAKDYKAGIKIPELMKKYKASRATISRVLNEMSTIMETGYRTRGKDGKKTLKEIFDAEQVELIMLLWEKGFPNNRIALLHGCSTATITKYIDRELSNRRARILAESRDLHKSAQAGKKEYK